MPRPPIPIPIPPDGTETLTETTPKSACNGNVTWRTFKRMNAIPRHVQVDKKPANGPDTRLPVKYVNARLLVVGDLSLKALNKQKKSHCVGIGCVNGPITKKRTQTLMPVATAWSETHTLADGSTTIVYYKATGKLNVQITDYERICLPQLGEDTGWFDMLDYNAGVSVKPPNIFQKLWDEMDAETKDAINEAYGGD